MEQPLRLRHTWKIKTQSPERVIQTLANAIEDSGYRLYRKRPASKHGSEVVGRKIVTSPRPKMLFFGLIDLAIAITLFYNSIPGEKISAFDIVQIVFGIIFCVFGILLVLGSTKLYRLSLVGRIQQETYQTGADMIERVVTAEVIGNRRPIWVTFEPSRRNWKQIPKEQRVLEEGFSELMFRLDTILPTLTVD